MNLILLPYPLRQKPHLTHPSSAAGNTGPLFQLSPHQLTKNGSFVEGEQVLSSAEASVCVWAKITFFRRPSVVLSLAPTQAPEEIQLSLGELFFFLFLVLSSFYPLFSSVSRSLVLFSFRGESLGRGSRKLFSFRLLFSFLFFQSPTSTTFLLPFLHSSLSSFLPLFFSLSLFFYLTFFSRSYSRPCSSSSLSFS